MKKTNYVRLNPQNYTMRSIGDNEVTIDVEVWGSFEPGETPRWHTVACLADAKDAFELDMVLLRVCKLRDNMPKYVSTQEDLTREANLAKLKKNRR